MNFVRYDTSSGEKKMEDQNNGLKIKERLKLQFSFIKHKKDTYKYNIYNKVNIN